MKKKIQKLTLLLSVVFCMVGAAFFFQSSASVPKTRQYPKVYDMKTEINCNGKLQDGRYFIKFDSIPTAIFTVSNGKITFNNTIQ